MTEYRVLLVTSPNEACSLTIARALVSEGLAACANIVDKVRSIYRWKGDICDDAEQLLIIKTRAEQVESLIDRVKALHDYEVPEVIALPILAGNPDYLDWIKQSTK